MNKLAQVVVEEAESEKLQGAEFESDNLLLRQKKKEDDIRLKLEEFAKELSLVQKQREGH
ncbi:MAG: hypothetical protein CMQ41_06205 [Gammaproteobacteria bacterium]|nr:hypothetical protein [Gammaproteobacteria bacterium]|tara:strand:+ start:202 stop:381 length:180 start_codon:yes stop_codon:yes gene_type:complete